MTDPEVARLLQLADVYARSWGADVTNQPAPQAMARYPARKALKDALRAALTPPNSLTKDEMLAKMVEVLREWPSPIAKGNAKILAGLAINRGFVLEGTVLTPPPGGA